jgi:hypothetical protein
MKKTIFVMMLILCTLSICACTSVPIACTQEAKICSDGSAVGRTGPNCEFAKCPDSNNIQNNSLKFLDDEDIRAELQNLKSINAYPDNKNIDSSQYPVILGIYSKNGLTLVEEYHCSDVCPDYGGVSMLFENITSEEQCTTIGGISIIDPAWQVYRGCAPAI